MKIKTKSGFECNVNEKKAKDWRFIKLLALCDSGDESDALKGITQAVPFLLGDKGEASLMEHVSKDGIASAEDIMIEFKEIMMQVGNASTETKN